MWRATGGGEKGDRDQTPCETDRNRIASKRVVYIESVPTSTLLDSSHRRDRREKPFMREHEDGCGRLRPLDTGGGSGKWRWPRCILAQTGPRWSGGEPAAFFRPSVPPSARQATDRGRGHSRAAFQSPSLRNVIHSPSADLLSDLQLGGAAPRWRLRASLVATRCDGAAVLRPKLARPDNQASRAGRGRAAGAGSCRDFDALHPKDDGFPRFPRSLARFPPFSRSSSLGLIR